MRINTRVHILWTFCPTSTTPHTKIPKRVLKDIGKAEVTLLHNLFLNVQQPLSKLLIVSGGTETREDQEKINIIEQESRLDFEQLRSWASLIQHGYKFIWQADWKGKRAGADFGRKLVSKPPQTGLMFTKVVTVATKQPSAARGAHTNPSDTQKHGCFVISEREKIYTCRVWL